MTAEQGGPDELLVGFYTLTSTLAAARRAATRSSTAAGQVPVTLLTGFLGSGKTTVLRHLLTSDHGLRITAIVNDLGSINVDTRTLEASAPPGEAATRLALTDGCACCALSDELADTLAEVAAGTRPDAVVIEASGAADAVAMAATIEAEPGTRLDGIVGLVDATAWSEQLDHPSLGPLVRRQLETAHLLLLSKVDLIDPGAVDRIVHAIGDVAPGRRIVPIVGGAVDPAVLLGAAVRGAAIRPSGQPHRPELATTTVRLDRAVDIARLAGWLETDHGLLRAKGSVATSDGGHHELQLVGRRWTLSPIAAPAETSLVLIADDAGAAAAAVETVLGLG